MKIMLVFENIVFVTWIMNIDQVIGDILAIDNIIRQVLTCTNVHRTVNLP